MSDIGFTIETVGNFPRESYDFKPIQNLINLPTTRPYKYLCFYSNQSNLYLPSLEGDQYLTISNGNIDKIESDIDYYTNGKHTFNAINFKKTKDYSYLVNQFQVETNAEQNSLGENLSYAYLFYPKILVFVPTLVSKLQNNFYSITLQASILEDKSIFVKNSLPSRRDILPFKHTQYLYSDNKTLTPYPVSVDNSCNFIYSISATKSIVGKNITTVPYGPTYQPNSLVTTLENNTFYKKIRRDRTVFDFSVIYTNYITLLPVNFSIVHPDNIEKYVALTTPLNFYNKNNNDQTFTLIQSSLVSNLPLQSEQNSIFKIDLNLNSTTLLYTCRSTEVKGINGTHFKISYIVDSANMIEGNESVQSTIQNQKFIIDGTETSLFSAIPSTKNGYNTVTYITKYPPHFYSYHISYTAPPDITDPVNEYCTSFSLTSVPYRETSTSILLSTYLKDNFGKINLDLETYGRLDKIKYQADQLDDPTILNDITAYVGTDTSRTTLYDLKNPPFLNNANNNTVLEIFYPNNREGIINLNIRPIIENNHSGTNAAQKASVIPIKGLYVGNQFELDIVKIKEYSDYVDLSIEKLNNEINYPFINLNDSNIEWKLQSPIDQNIKIVSLTKSGTNEYYPSNNILTPNTTIPYNSNSWAIRLSGYGAKTTIITLSSQKYNNTTLYKTDSNFFNFYEEEKLKIKSVINLNNENEIRTITLSAYVPYKNREYNLPSTGVIYWSWKYNNLESYTTPITAKYVKSNKYYNIYDNDTADNIDTLQFLIKPNKSNSPNINTLEINVYTADTLKQYTGRYEILDTLDDFPNDNIFNADFDITYPSYPNDKLLETRKGQYVLSRLKNLNAIYKLTANTDAIPTNSTLTWTITDSDNITTTFTGNTCELDARNKSKYSVKLKVSNAIVNGWGDTRHSTERNCVIYSLDSSIFDKQLKFISYPEYAWKNSDQATLLTSSNYNTIAAGTTAYAYKKDKTEVFYVSANVNFDRYVYQQGSSRDTLLDTTNDGVNKLTLKYTDDFLSSVGTKLYLSAFNEYFPSNTPLYYKTIEGSSLVTKSYNIVAESIPYSVSTASDSLFFQNPKLMDYNGITHTFSATITSFDLDVNRSVLIRQKFQNNPLNTPAKIQSDSSTVTYILSAPKWIVKREIPAVDGIFNVFTIKPGDDLSPLRVKNTSINTLYLNASSNLNIKIPETTFDTIKQSNPDFDSGDFWDTKNITIPKRTDWETLQAYTTSTQPEIFLNTAYTLSGNQVFVEFNTPEYTTNPIVSYDVNFGEGDIQTKPKGEIFYNTYTTSGTFYITYSAIYQDSTKKVFTEKTPFIIKKNWDEYNKESIRIISEANLELPYSLNDISIQPNEFGDADIFNTCLTRIDDNLNYLKNNIQTVNSNAPSYYYGWMGSNQDNRSDGIRWYTPSYGSEFYETPNYAASEGTSYFTDIKDIHIGKYIYVLDDKRFRLFEKDKNCKEVKFSNPSDMDELFFNPQSITVNEDETSIYVADSIRHKIYRFDFDFSDLQNPLFGLVLTVGTLGGLNDNSRFDFPSEIFLWNDNVFVLDYNNNCIKQYSGSLSWIHTYYDDVLKNDQILNFTVHESGLIYAVTKNLKVHIFDELAKSVYSTFDVAQIGESEIVKMEFDENGEFLYITTTGNVFKYSSVGEFLTTFNLPNINGLKFTSCKHSSNRELYVSTNKSILKFQDFVDLFKIGDGLDSKYWSLDQILLKKEEFATDINYNLALNRTAQNLKTFRNSLNGKFVLVSEQTARGSATYFSLIPILKEDNVKFGSDVENEQLKIGVNEFYIPDVVNREFKKLHDSQISLRENLDVSFSDSSSSNLDGEKSKCGGDFCWSWKAMSCYDLSLPLIRLCNINPITYAELMNTFPVNYAPKKLWKDATSNCCNEYTSPLT
jgi:hypothetical protein